MIKKEKQQAIVTLLITGLIFGILCMAAWFHTPNQISVSERRRLAQLPALTKDSVGKGNFMSGFERYSQDQFPFREAFRKLKTKALFSLYQQKDVHGIYVADGYAASIESEINEASVQHAVNAFEHVYAQYLKNDSYEIYAATLRERNRIAREIHDNVGHLLSRTILLTGAAKTLNQDKNMESLLEGLDTSLNSAMNSIRSSVHNLHDESETLREITIKGIITDIKMENVEFEYDMSEIIPNKIKYCFAAIIKEALSNVIKHSNATAVKIVLREHPALYQLCIEDNGKGYSEKEADSKGIGLKNMQERVTSLGGTLQINGKNGFRIFAVIPKQQD